MTLSDQDLIYVVGIVGPIFGFVTAWIATHERHTASLNETVDSRIRIILQERQERVDELQRETHKLRIVVENFRDVMQAVLRRARVAPAPTKAPARSSTPTYRNGCPAS